MLRQRFFKRRRAKLGAVSRPSQFSYQFHIRGELVQVFCFDHSGLLKAMIDSVPQGACVVSVVFTDVKTLLHILMEIPFRSKALKIQNDSIHHDKSSSTLKPVF